MTNPPIIEFKSVSKRFGRKTVLSGINLQIEEGEILAIIGRSGSGKSTLMKIFLGVHRPDSGKVFYRGNDILRTGRELKSLVGLTTQENSFYERLTVYENMVYYGNLYNRKISLKDLKARILEILKWVELEEELKTLAGNLSGGMKRRLDFAISMVHDPVILMLDEPTTGLDPILVEQFWRIVEGVAKKGKTIIVISHVFPEIEEHCSRACVLHHGQIAKIVEITNKTDLKSIFHKAVEAAR